MAAKTPQRKMESICFNCSEIIQGKILTALGKTYHPEHFTCTKCNQPITASKFQESDGMPYCEADYTELFSKKCHSCDLPIKEKVISALGFSWHEEHFCCAACKVSLAGQSFYEKDGRPYCKQDYLSNFADKCAECGLPIADRAIVALDAKWHQNCFKCIKCRNPVVDSTFQVENGKPICAKCSI